MKQDISFLPDDEYMSVVSEWDEYAGVPTAELMERYDTTEIQSTEIYSDETGVLNLVQFYHLYDCTHELNEYLYKDDDFKKKCHIDDFKSAIDQFVGLLETEMRYCGFNYFLDCADTVATSYLEVKTPSEILYLNLDEIWAYWVGLNKENYFDA